MYDIQEATLTSLSIHQIGNKLNGKENLLSSKPVTIKDDSVKSALITYFFSSFKRSDIYQFEHETDLQLNEIYTYATKIFDQSGELHSMSTSIAKHLYEQGTHPQIRDGQLYVAYFENCFLNGTLCEVIGLFKSESKDIFLKILSNEDSFDVTAEEGVNIQKLDKGCLIFNIDKQNGYQVLLVESGGQTDTKYWKTDFLRVVETRNSYFHTTQAMQVCNSFITEKLKQSFEIDRAGEIELIQRSQKYFREKETFDKVSFAQDVFQQPEVIDAFEGYTATASEKSVAEFDISPSALKNAKRIFKSVIKLDKNFHIYVHGRKEYIVKGYDEESGLHYYQLFFKEES